MIKKLLILYGKHVARNKSTFEIAMGFPILRGKYYVYHDIFADKWEVIHKEAI